MRRLRRFARRRQNLLGLLIVLAFVALAVAAPRLAPPDDPAAPEFRSADTNRFTDIPEPPSRLAPLGTTATGMSVYHTLVWGSRSALYFGLVVTATTALLGIVIGAGAAYAGGWLNGLLMRVTDAFLAFPLIAGVWMVLQLALPPRPMFEPPPNALALLMERLHLTPLMLGFILFSWMPYARLVNAAVLNLKQATFVQAAQALGAGGLRILLRHLIPNGIGPALVLAARDVGGMVILATAFTYIGIGDGPVWGEILAQSRNWIIGVGGNPFSHWWVFLPVTLVLILFGIGWNLLGDGLNALLNPRTD